MNISQLESVLKKSRNKDTCYFKSEKEWTADNPCIGHCTITALIVQDYFGGDIVFCSHQDHYWNILPNGEIVDMTKNQMSENDICYIDQKCNRIDLLEGPKAVKAKTKERYMLLKNRMSIEMEGGRE